MIFLHKVDKPAIEKAEDIALELIDHFTSESFNKCYILDNHFKVIDFFHFLKRYHSNYKPKLPYEVILYELIDLPNIDEWHVIIKNDKSNEFLNRTCEFIIEQKSSNIFEYYAHNKKFVFYRYFKKEKNSIEKSNYRTDLHDRWIILSNVESRRCIHLGISLFEFYGKDFTMSLLSKEYSKVAFERFNEIVNWIDKGYYE